MLLQDILPEGTGGIVAVFEIGDITFTYAVNGKNAKFLGRGDLHRSQYDHMERKFHFLGAENSTQGHHLYTGLPLSDATIKAIVSIYPSEDMEEVFFTNNAIIYTVIVVLTFVFMSALFVVYDRLRTRALDKATHTAVESAANVALLEDMVKNRTQELESANTKLEEANREVVRASEARLRHFASMSHEIRTPLVSFCDAAKTRGPYYTLAQIYGHYVFFACLTISVVYPELRHWNGKSFARQ
jgi:Mg2+ and Co2+ transporter CorA